MSACYGFPASCGATTVTGKHRHVCSKKPNHPEQMHDCICWHRWKEHRCS